MTTKTPQEMRNLLRSLRVDIDDALLSVCKHHGVTLKAGNATFSPDGGNFHFKLEGVVAGGLTREAQAFQSSAVLYGLKAEDLGRTFAYNGQTYTITGMNRSGKVQITNPAGKEYKMNAESVKRYLAATGGHDAKVKAKAPAPAALASAPSLIWAADRAAYAEYVYEAKANGIKPLSIDDWMRRLNMPIQQPAAKQPQAPKPKSGLEAMTLDELYPHVAAAMKLYSADLKDRWGHLNPGMQRMQLLAAARRAKKVS